MPRCSSYGCSCSYCEDCGKLYENCICDLTRKTIAWLKEPENNNDPQYSLSLLQEWLDAS